MGEQRAAALRRARVPARLLPGARCSLPRVLGGVGDWHVPGQCLHVQACDWSIVRCTCMHDEQHQQHVFYWGPMLFTVVCLGSYQKHICSHTACFLSRRG